VALVMSVWRVCAYIPDRERFWTLMCLRLVVFLLAGWRRSREALLAAAAFSLAGLAVFWLPPDRVGLVYWPNALALLGLLAQRQIARRRDPRGDMDDRFHAALIAAGGLSLCRLLSQWVLESASGFYLTASWSALALALFGCGIALSQRVYRWLGLPVLAAALGRAMLCDVWKLETLYRVLSFCPLGVVLLLLEFIYNKYQEKLRRFL